MLNIVNQKAGIERNPAIYIEIRWEKAEEMLYAYDWDKFLPEGYRRIGRIIRVDDVQICDVIGPDGPLAYVLLDWEEDGRLMLREEAYEVMKQAEAASTRISLGGTSMVLFSEDEWEEFQVWVNDPDSFIKIADGPRMGVNEEDALSVAKRVIKKSAGFDHYVPWEIPVWWYAAGITGKDWREVALLKAAWLERCYPIG